MYSLRHYIIYIRLSPLCQVFPPKNLRFQGKINPFLIKKLSKKDALPFLRVRHFLSFFHLF
ncbi:hypothetical protein HMPREF1548_03064 [Clostridium sp. KLE 1755]|nr:hypothetical protein HMPREF1548_03064 [Clostridium sp. KLE 1755]